MTTAPVCRGYRADVRFGLTLPIFNQLSDPRVVADLAAAAEDAGWDGVFVWDHVAYGPRVSAIADPWVTLAAVAVATRRVLIGPMVTPLPRRRPIQVAREVTTLDHLSGGRVVLGVGIGGDHNHELSGTGEQTDDRVRGAMLDEALEVLAAAWTGEPVHHQGEHYVLDGLTVGPPPVQRPGPPVWVALRRGNRGPLRRAARYDAMFPIEVESPDRLAALVAEAQRLRDPGAGPLDVAVDSDVGDDPAPWAAAGATWWLKTFSAHDATVDEVRAAIAARPG